MDTTGMTPFIVVLLGVLYCIWLFFWPVLMYNRMNKIIKLLEKKEVR
jgi:hypothetical protein